MPAVAQKVKSAPFSYLPEQGADRYDMRVPHKTLALADGSRLCDSGPPERGRLRRGALRHRPEKAVEHHHSRERRAKRWRPLGAAPQQALVVLHHKDESSQNLTVVPVNLQSGQSGARQSGDDGPAPATAGRACAISPDGSRLLAFRYLTRDQQVKSIAATLFDQNLSQLEEKTYDFRDLGDFFSPAVHVANDGTQYVTLHQRRHEEADRAPLPGRRRHRNQGAGRAGGRRVWRQAVTMRDARFTVLNDGSLYAAALCADYATGEYYSLKVVKFDFSGEPAT